MSLDILTRHELNELLEIIHSVVYVHDIDQLSGLAYSLRELIEYNYIIFGLPKSSSNNILAVDDLNINYPQDWVDLYQAKELWRVDPVIAAAKEKGAPQNWIDIYRRFPPSKRFLGLAHDFGLKDGWTCLARGGTGLPCSIISAGGDCVKSKHNKKRVECILEMISPHFHIAISSLRAKNEAKRLQSLLTKREYEVLKWLSQGKTSWAISVILNVSESIINFHVNNINAKFNTVGRGHAVAVAIHSGLDLDIMVNT